MSPRGFADFTDVTLAEYTNSILNNNANSAFQGNVAMQVTQPGGQLWNQCKWYHLMTKFAMILFDFYKRIGDECK